MFLYFYLISELYKIINYRMPKKTNNGQCQLQNITRTSNNECLKLKTDTKHVNTEKLKRLNSNPGVKL